MNEDKSIPSPEEANVPEKGSTAVSEADVWETLRMVFDPELPVSIVDLGLVYDIRIEGKSVFVKMTLTMPGCVMGPSIAGDAQNRILALPGVEEANVEIVWDPPWNQGMISEVGRMQLGMV